MMKKLGLTVMGLVITGVLSFGVSTLSEAERATKFEVKQYAAHGDTPAPARPDLLLAAHGDTPAPIKPDNDTI